MAIDLKKLQLKIDEIFNDPQVVDDFWEYVKAKGITPPPYQEREVRQGEDGWVNEKPDFKTECSFVTASSYKRNDEPITWEYKVWSTLLLLGEDEQGAAGYYLGLLNGEGEEWGPLEDLTADKYFILPPTT